MGHIVTAESSPDPGPEGEWKIRDSVEGCENVVLTIEMERSPSEGGESGGGESESGTSDPVVVTPEPTDDGGGDDDAGEGEDKVCITSCSAPDTFEWCCEEYETNKWCHKKFRKLKRKTPPPDDDSEGPLVGEVDTPESE